ncbi:DUF2975 domain-containing protein [Fictibacillus iocasae]|uniref:DUF2975 domain-containing protein n=1 Tax=Fictibacillus iocasae TaxID=2715437 RepID=A0ABW2NP26_9BACL
MKLGSTLFLKLAVFVIASPVLALSVAGLLFLPDNPANPKFAPLLYPIVIGLYVSSIPFYAALFQACKLLGHIDKNQAFSALSVRALTVIKRCAILISLIFVILEPFVFQLAELDDAPGLVIMGMVPVFASMVIAVFAAVLQRLLQQAIDIKSENDLTI